MRSRDSKVLEADWATVLGATSLGLLFFAGPFSYPFSRLSAMKLKQQPEDFQVEELTDVVPASGGPFALYRLDKRSWATLDALQAMRRRWRIEPRRVSYGGLKDRHARTVQYLTIFHGPQRGLKHHDVTLRYLGQVTKPYT